MADNVDEQAAKSASTGRMRRDVGHGLPVYKLRYRVKLLLSELESIKKRELDAQAEVRRLQREGRESEQKASLLACEKAEIEASAGRAQLDYEKQTEKQRVEFEEHQCREDSLREKLSALMQSRNSSMESLKAENYSLRSSLELKVGELKMAKEKLMSQTSLVEAVECEADRVQRVVEDALAQQDRNDDGVQRLKRLMESALDCEELSECIASLQRDSTAAAATIEMRDKEILFLKSKLEIHETGASAGKDFSFIEDSSESTIDNEVTIMKEIHDVEEFLSRGQGD